MQLVGKGVILKCLSDFLLIVGLLFIDQVKELQVFVLFADDMKA
jgi:hypothetical protein